MFKYFIYQTLFLSGILLVSCTEKIEVELDNAEPSLVIEGRLTNEPGIHSIRVSMTSPYFSDEPVVRVSGAEVYVVSPFDTIHFFEADPGIYQSAPWVRGYPGYSYMLHVKYENNIYEATETMQKMVKVDSIKLYRTDEPWKNLSVGLYAWDPPEPDNYYLFTVDCNHRLETDSLSEIILANDRLFNGQNFSGVLVQYLHASLRDTISLNLAAISEEYYEYLRAVLKETKFASGPFEAAPAPIRGNLSHGAQGYFSVEALSSKTVIFSEIAKK